MLRSGHQEASKTMTSPNPNPQTEASWQIDPHLPRKWEYRERARGAIPVVRVVARTYRRFPTGFR